MKNWVFKLIILRITYGLPHRLLIQSILQISNYWIHQQELKQVHKATFKWTNKQKKIGFTEQLLHVTYMTTHFSCKQKDVITYTSFISSPSGQLFIEVVNFSNNDLGVICLRAELFYKETSREYSFSLWCVLIVITSSDNHNFVCIYTCVYTYGIYEKVLNLE